MKLPTYRLFAILLLFTGATLADDWKLKPLKYNNPGLVVDLGVGLWAWPMPMDYDGDGDLDLLVACPDKPSNGVYFFENPSNDPKVKTPVFLPGKRVGPAGHNMQVSYVGGTPRVLKENKWLVEAMKGDLETSVNVYPNPKFHEGKTRGRMWRFVDYDADGDQDLVVGVGDWSDYGWDHAYDSQGRWQNGPLHGYVYLIENLGDQKKARYSNQPRRIQAAGGDIDVYGWPSPNFADFDRDGDLDLICGEFLDGFTWFENVGTAKSPSYAAGQRLLNPAAEKLSMDLQMITPTAIDWDADGDQDLIVGDEDGRVAFIENTGQSRKGMPIFKNPVYFQQQADTLKCGALATPYAFDWDGDGDEDILCGNTAGYIDFFENLGDGKDGMPKWSAPRHLSVTREEGKQVPFRIQAGPSGSIQGPCEAKWGYTTLSVADWDADQDPDIIFNSIHSRIGVLRNDGATLVEVGTETDPASPEAPPRWYWWKTKSDSALTQWRTTPVAVDFDTDGRLDIVALDQEGFLTLRSNGGEATRIFVDEDLSPIRLNARSAGRSGRVKLAVADWDQDGRKDIIVNSENATWYRNCKNVDGRIVLKRIGNLANRNVAGHTSSPAVCDFDGNSTPDLLVGAENGRIYHIRHEDCKVWPEADLQARPAKTQEASRFPGLVSEDFVFTKASFPQCHASSICETSRGVVVTWFGGTEEKAKDVGIWVSYNDGGGWSSPQEWANGIQHANHRHPCWNPVLYQSPGDGPLLLFFKVGPTPRDWWGEMMVSYDRGRTFRDRRRLPETIDGPVRCKPILLDDGRTLLCGSSTEYDGWRVHFESIQLLAGQPSGVWNRVGPINTADEFNAIQPTFLRHQDGRLQVLCRTKESVIASSFSNDQGQTWSKLSPTNLPNPNSGVDAVTLKDGRHLLIYNHLDSGKSGWGRRGLLNLAISNDGVTWNAVGELEREKDAEFSYPAMIQAADGLVHMSYTWKRQRIKRVVLDPKGIKVGAELSLDAWPE